MSSRRLAYFENFLHEFHRRQRDELLRQPLWRMCLQRAQDFMFRSECSLAGFLSSGSDGGLGLRRGDFAEDLSRAKCDCECRRPERSTFVATVQRRERLESRYPGRHT